MDMNLIALTKLDPQSEAFFGSPIDEEAYYAHGAATSNAIERVLRAILACPRLLRELRDSVPSAVHWTRPV